MTTEAKQDGENHNRFRTTRWSLISEIRDPDDPFSKSILNELFLDYWRPVYSFIRKTGIQHENAKDLTQEFFYKILYQKNLFAKAQRTKGKFRNLLLKSLMNFLSNEKRRISSKKKHPDRAISIHIDILDDMDLIPRFVDGHEEDSFNYAWIGSMVNNISQRMEQQYCAKDKQIHWLVFKDRVLSPIWDNSPAPSLPDLCRTYSIDSEVKASNMITSVKRSFRNALRNHIREYVNSDSEVDAELSDLIRFLSKYVQDL